MNPRTAGVRTVPATQKAPGECWLMLAVVIAEEMHLHLQKSLKSAFRHLISFHPRDKPVAEGCDCSVFQMRLQGV